MPRGSYCDLLEQIKLECFEKSILEVWGYDRELLESLTQEDIIDAINTVDTSAIFGYPTNFTDYLGGITRDKDGNIIGAKVMMQSWLSMNDPKKVIKGVNVDEFGSGNEVDTDSIAWEEKFVETLLNETNRPEAVNVYVFSSHSFSAISAQAIMGDVGYLVLGYMVVFLYVQVMLGKFNIVETRPFLSMLGILAVQFSVVISYGLSSALGFKFGPVNNILPFLLLGLGIDDMFVIMQAHGEADYYATHMLFISFLKSKDIRKYYAKAYLIKTRWKPMLGKVSSKM